MPAEMAFDSRAGFVRFNQQLARLALARGGVEAARRALRVLRTTDFAGGAAVSQGYLAILRDHRASEGDVRQALMALAELGPAGGA